jgi:hypothetical protein
LERRDVEKSKGIRRREGVGREGVGREVKEKGS